MGRMGVKMQRHEISTNFAISLCPDIKQILSTTSYGFQKIKIVDLQVQVTKQNLYHFLCL